MKRIVALSLTLSLLIACIPALAATDYGKEKAVVEAVQRELTDKGLYTGKNTGKINDATTNALKKFQKEQGMKQNGKLDDALLQALFTRDKELTFQNIPWGSSMEEVKQAALNLGLIEDQESAMLLGETTFNRMDYLPAYHEPLVSVKDEKETYYASLMYFMELSKVIGGYTGNLLCMFASSGDETQLIQVQYGFNYGSYDEEAILAGLTAAYGNPLPYPFFGGNPRYVWYGANQTAIYYHSGVLYYGVLNSAEIIKAIKANAAPTEAPASLGF